jgi:hypothetical protein
MVGRGDCGPRSPVGLSFQDPAVALFRIAKQAHTAEHLTMHSRINRSSTASNGSAPRSREIFHLRNADIFHQWDNSPWRDVDG